MLIRVVHRNGRFGLIDDSLLDELISRGEIRLFMRSNGWVHPDCDPVRMPGTDRRRSGCLVNIYV